MDIVLEVIIVCSTKLLLDSYNDERRRVIGAMAKKADEFPEPADLSLSYASLLVFAVISVVFDLYESWQAVYILGEYKELHDDNAY